MKKYITVLIVFLLIFVPSIALAYVSLTPSPSAPDGISPMAQTILGAIQYIGYAIALGMIIYVGIKYTMSAANEKADLKRASINYVIGAIIIAGAVTICNWVVLFFQDANSGGTGGGTPPGGSYPSSSPSDIESINW